MNDFAIPIEEARNKDATDYQLQRGEIANLKLQEIIQPYFLQRLKVDYLADKLPPKSDIVVWTHISSRQRSMYKSYIGSKESAVASVLNGESKSPLEAITWLKKLCGHPILVDESLQGTSINMRDYEPSQLVQDSSKLGVLVELVGRLSKGNHRTLIFSQSTRMLDVIERVLSSKFKLSRIDGSTKEKDRQSRVDDFNSGKSKTQAMLLSTKAAGVGLTLTG
jgi:SNF2 family DNA or RNA helicase